MNIQEIELKFDRISQEYNELLIHELHAKCILACKILGISQLTVLAAHDDGCDFLNIDTAIDEDFEPLHLNSLLAENGIPEVRDIDFINSFPNFERLNIGMSTKIEDLLLDPCLKDNDLKGNNSIEINI